MTDKLTKRQIRNRELWIAALRSGKYRQSTGGLKVSDGFCCLGVACAVGVAKAPFDRPEDWGSLDGDSAESCLGITSAGRLDKDDNDNLIHLNDCHGWTFSEIADLIELDTVSRS